MAECDTNKEIFSTTVDESLSSEDRDEIPFPPLSDPIIPTLYLSDNVIRRHVVDEKTMKMRILVSAFSSKQHDQYEVYRRATFARVTVKRLIMSICKSTIQPNAVIAMAGIAKVFVGQIVEEACMLKDTLGYDGPLLPKHIREAHRRVRNREVTAKNKKLNLLI